MNLIDQIKASRETTNPILDKSLEKLCALPYEDTGKPDGDIGYFNNNIAVNFPMLEVGGLATRFVFTLSFADKVVGGSHSCGYSRAALQLGEDENPHVQFDIDREGLTLVTFKDKRLRGPCLGEIGEHMKKYRKGLQKKVGKKPVPAFVYPRPR